MNASGQMMILPTWCSSDRCCSSQNCKRLLWKISGDYKVPGKANGTTIWYNTITLTKNPILCVQIPNPNGWVIRAFSAMCISHYCFDGWCCKHLRWKAWRAVRYRKMMIYFDPLTYAPNKRKGLTHFLNSEVPQPSCTLKRGLQVDKTPLSTSTYNGI